MRNCPAQHLTGLDGIRAVAIGLVLLAHYGPAAALPAWTICEGPFGVTVFFVLSGYLITTLLLREEHANGRISLRLFYARRALRILPPAYVYLAVVAVLILVGVFPPDWESVAGAAFFYRSFLPIDKGVEPAGHFWSLSIEEQFYFVWPLALVLTSTSTRLLLAGFVVSVPLWRSGLSLWLTGTPYGGPPGEFHYDALMAGCLMALLEDAGCPLPRRGFWGLVALAVLIASFADVVKTSAVPTLLPTLRYGCVAVVIAVAVRNPAGLWARLFELPPLAWMGRLSYSLYIWQQLFAPEIGLDWPWFVGLPLTFLAASGSYYLLEKPLNELRKGLRAARPTPANAAQYRSSLLAR